MFTVGKNGINIRDVVGPKGVLFILGMNLHSMSTSSLCSPDKGFGGILEYIHLPPVLKVENRFISEI